MKFSARSPGSARRRALRLAAAAALCGCGAEPRPDVLLVSVDTLRADALGCLGYPRDATPNLDRLAAGGVLYTRHYSSSSQTGPAHASLFSGRLPSEHGVVKNGVSVPHGCPWLPEEFQAGGWSTAAVIGALVLDRRFGFERGFAWFEDRIDAAAPAGGGPALERPAGTVVDLAARWLSEAGTGPVFLWVHVFDPHEPYAPPVPPPLASAGAGAFFRSRAEANPFFDAARQAQWRRGYEAEVSYTDQQLGRLFAAFEGRPGDRIVAVTSDHGEGLGEHGYQGHHFYLYEEQVHVPLILWGRGGPAERLPAGTRVGAVTSALELAEALRRLAGLPPAGDPSRLLERALAPGPDPGSQAFLERAHLTEFDLERSPAIRRLLEFHGPGPAAPRGRLWGLVESDAKWLAEAGQPGSFFDLRADPQEQAALPDGARAAGLSAALEARRGALTPHADRAIDPAVERALEALGY